MGCVYTVPSMPAAFMASRCASRSSILLISFAGASGSSLLMPAVPTAAAFTEDGWYNWDSDEMREALRFMRVPVVSFRPMLWLATISSSSLSAW